MGIGASLAQALLEQRVRKALQGAGLLFGEHVALDRYQADFIFQTPDGAKHIVEAKALQPSRPEVLRAMKLAGHLRDLPVGGGHVVFPRLEKEHLQEGVLSVDGLNALLKTSAAQQPPKATKSTKISTTKPQKLIFAAMPFASKYDDVFFVAIRGAAKLASSVAKRVDKEDYSGDVVDRIRQRIAQASAIVVDLSESRPNVLYKMGFAQASGKPVVPICSTHVDEIPFDVRNLNILMYEVRQTHLRRPKLSRRLRAVFTA
jgi:hypothetical protein